MGTQELERAVRLLSGKSDAHKAVSTLSSELAGLRMSEQRLKSDVDFFRERAAKAEQVLILLALLVLHYKY